MRNRRLGRGVLCVLLAVVVSAILGLAVRRLVGPDVEGTRDVCRANRSLLVALASRWMDDRAQTGSARWEPHSLSVLVPDSIAAIPTCPAAGDVYSRGYVSARAAQGLMVIQCPVHGVIGVVGPGRGKAELQGPFPFSIGGVQPGWARSRYIASLGPAPREGKGDLHFESGVDVRFNGLMWSEGEPAAFWIAGDSLEFNGRRVVMSGDSLDDASANIQSLDRSMEIEGRLHSPDLAIPFQFNYGGGFGGGLEDDGHGRVTRCWLYLW